MEHMESKMQDHYEAAEQWRRDAFADGIERAARLLKESANRHDVSGRDRRAIAESQGHNFSATILRSYANGLDIEADKARKGTLTEEVASR